MHKAVWAFVVLTGLAAPGAARLEPAQPDAGPTANASAPSAAPLTYVPIRKPAGELRYYPDEALGKEISGRVVLRCHFRENRSLRDCAVLSETPPGLGFGQAAVKLAYFAKVKPAELNGQPVAGRTVDVPIIFNLN